MRTPRILLATSVVLTACNTTEGPGVNAKSEVQNAWAVDMSKVPGEYGATTSTFFGATHSEAKLPDLEAIMTPMGMGDVGAALNNTMIWDQAFRRSVGDKGQGVAVIMEDGTLVDPTSGSGEDLFINIVPMFKDTDPTGQTAIREMMQDGDVIVYFHPEFDSAKDFMERRASHVAMHYEYKADSGVELVHHIDNPNNYGPAYNHRPSKHMPFHVFRFQPDAEKTFTTRGGDSFQVSADQARVYNKTARNWAFITNDQSPFADFFTLNLKQRSDLDRFASNALNGLDIPEVYCSGLAFTNLNLALNFPLNSEGLGDMMGAFEQGSYMFSDAGRDFTMEDLNDAINNPVKPLNELVFAPYGASDMIDVWVDTYMSHIPDEVKMGIFADPEFQGGMVQALSQLEWSDSARGEFSRAQYTPANSKNIKRWADAFNQPVEALAGYLEADHALYGENGDEDGMSLLEAADWLLENEEIEIDLETERTPMAVLKDIESHLIKNRFVPPRIWMDEGDLDTSNMMYVGTVVNCEILSPADGSGGEACPAGTSGSKSFKEGAADTQTYPHYAVKDGGEKTHRRFDATPGPQFMDLDATTISFRATASAAEDIMFVLHTPDTWYDGSVDNTLGMAMFEYDEYCTERNGAGESCAPETGIAFRPAALGFSGPVEDVTFTFQMSDVCTAIDADDILCDTTVQRVGGEWVSTADANAAGQFAIGPESRGLWDATMVDLGTTSEGQPVDTQNCIECENGGAHFNQWVLTIQAPLADAQGTDPGDWQ